MTTFFQAGKWLATIPAARVVRVLWRFLWEAAVMIALFSQAMADPLPEQAEIHCQGWVGLVTFVVLANDLG